MKPIFVRDAKTPEDSRLCSEWIARISGINLLDVDVFSYPATTVRCAYQSGEGPKLYVPVHPVQVLESLAPAPGSEGMLEAAALKAIICDAVATASRLGHGELFFQCSDERVIEFAQKWGFALSKIPLLKMKVGK